MLDKKWNEKYRKLLEDLKLKDDPAAVPSSALSGSTTAMTMMMSSNKLTLDEKRAFAKSLYKLTKEDLGRILVEIEKKHPAALVRNNSEDEVELNVDKIPSSLFVELQAFVKSATTGSGGGSSKPKKKSNSGGGGGASGGKRQKA